MAMRSEARVEAEAEEEEHFGPQPLSRLEVCIPDTVCVLPTNTEFSVFTYSAGGARGSVWSHFVCLTG